MTDPSSSSIKILPYEDRHREAFSALNVEWIEHYFTVEKIDREQMDAPRQHILDPGGEIFMAELDGVAVGTVAMIPFKTDQYELAKMAVTPSAQGHGVGGQLVEAALSWARSHRARSVMLLSNRVLGPALHLYRKAGFVEIPMDPRAEEYNRCDITMEIALDA